MRRIEPFSIGELCDALEYTRKNSYRLKRDLLQPTFYHNGKRESIITMASGETWGVDKTFMIVNPLIYYGGNSHKEVEELGCFGTSKS